MSGADFRNVHVDDLRMMFDLVVSSLDFGSGFLDTEEMVVLDRIGQMVSTERVRCRGVDTEYDRIGSCSLPIGHKGGHEFMGQGCVDPKAPKWRDGPRYEAHQRNFIRLSELAARSGVAAFPNRMI